MRDSATPIHQVKPTLTVNKKGDFHFQETAFLFDTSSRINHTSKSQRSLIQNSATD
jgi:hypothetical protein